ncbi:MAG: glycosyltransferase [Parachlamydiales bacterium]|jgi:sterol 3beta-glucosyltransferase
MKICILCIGSHGDIRPYVALANGLKANGHDVWIASHQKAQSLCQKYNLDFKLVDGDLTEAIHSEETQEKLKSIFVLPQITQLFRNVLKIQLPMSLEAAANADLLIYSPVAFAGPHLAEYLKIPTICMHVLPEIRTKCHSSYLFPRQKSYTGLKHYLGHFVSEQFLWQPIRAPINKWRKKQLGMRKMHFLGFRNDKIRQEIPEIVAFSPSLIPRPIDWPSKIEMTNFCLLREGENWTPPKDLENFLDNDQPTIYVGFGSLTEACEKSTVKKIIDALIKKNIRAVVHGKLRGLKELELPASIFPLDYAPHDWLFPRVKAVIHHGGIGTTAAGLYAGKPTWIIPFVWDQFYWGQKIFDLGIGPKPIPVYNIDTAPLMLNLDDLLSQSTYQQNASKFRTQLQSEPDGVQMTINSINNILATRI